MSLRIFLNVLHLHVFHHEPAVLIAKLNESTANKNMIRD